MQKADKETEKISREDFLKNTPLMFAGGTMIGGMAPEHIEGFEKTLGQILEKGTIGTGKDEQKIKPEDLKEFRKMAEEIADMKREYLTMQKGVRNTEDILDYDASNPMLLKVHPKAWNMQQLASAKEKSWSKQEQLVKKCGLYVKEGNDEDEEPLEFLSGLVQRDKELNEMEKNMKKK